MKFNNHVKNQYNNLAISDKLAKTDPFFFKNNCSTFVSGFGNTLKSVNNQPKQNNGFDWYYKGNENGLLSNNDTMYFPNYGFWSGFETEILTVHCIDQNLKPHYVGYTLAIDISNTGMRRSCNSFQNISHLSYTALGDKLLRKPLPEFCELQTDIIRNGDIVWTSKGLTGTKNMWDSPNQIFEYLFRNKMLLQPGMIFYTLTGAAISTDKAGIRLQNNDRCFSKITDESISININYCNENQ